jgi:uncharacterized membrane protein
MDDHDTPTYNPSSWGKRLPVAGLAVVGFLVAGYLTLYQLRVLPTVWEPFFGRGSEVVLNSWVARLLPVPDASLGALGYLAELVTDLIGGRSRWRTRPGVVLLFGACAAGMALASVVLVVLQPVAFGAWCTLCLTSAAISVTVMALAADEVLAGVRHLRRESAGGRSVWRALWGLGG